MKELSGDIHQPFSKKLIYISRNLWRNIPGIFLCGNSTYWHPERISDDHSSPGRKYVDAFVLDFLERTIQTKGSPISVLDIGCGSGYVRSLLAKKGIHADYTGIDVFVDKRFSQYEQPGIVSRLLERSIEEYEPIERFDFVISMTSLEHIVHDDHAVEKALQCMKPTGIGLHVVPGVWSLPLYLLHGYRQYSISRLTSLFGGKGRSVKIYRLGGLFSFLLHLFIITIPERSFSRWHPRQRMWYPAIVSLCNKLDRLAPFFSYMYVVVVI